MNLLIGLGVGIVVVFWIAHALFGPAMALILSASVGACFGGPPGAGVGILVGIVLLPVTALLGAGASPSATETDRLPSCTLVRDRDDRWKAGNGP